MDLRGEAGGLPALLYVELTPLVQTFTHKRLQVLLAAATAEREGEGGAGNRALKVLLARRTRPQRRRTSVGQEEPNVRVHIAGKGISKARMTHVATR